MTREREVPVRIIIRKKKGGHAHHGGAWKVAFADFMTAMFALFLVLWLVNQSSDVKAAVAGYFADPMGRANEFGSSILPGDGSQSNNLQTVKLTRLVELRRARLNQVAHQLRERLDNIPALEGVRDKVEIELTSEGLRIQLLEDPNGVFFETGSAGLSSSGREILAMLGNELGKLPNSVRIEGHTDARPYSGLTSYSNWELSADRANAARRILTASGLPDRQIVQIRGLADRSLRVPSDPLSASNRRISIMVLLSESSKGDAPGSAATAADSSSAATAAAAVASPDSAAPEAAASTEHAP
jgi:chemotaxis protein MotB